MSDDVDNAGEQKAVFDPLAESTAEREARKQWLLQARIMRLCGLTGAWGILTGFALFLAIELHLLHAPGILAAELVLAVVAAFIIEYLRAMASGHGADEEKKPKLPHLLSSILMLVTFEMYILAVHYLGKMDDWHEMVTGVFGASGAEEAYRGVNRARWNLIAFVFIWTGIGAVLGRIFGQAIRRMPLDNAAAIRMGLITGLKAGLVYVPLVVFASALMIRVGWGVWVWSASGEWPHDERFITLVFPLVLLVSAACALSDPKGMLVGAIAIPVWMILRFDPSFEQWSMGIPSAVTAALQAAALWGVPALVLGGFLPFLRRPSNFRWLWSPLAMGLAVLCMALVIIRQQFWLAVPAVILAGTAILFRRSKDLEAFWPLFAVCAAVAAFSLTWIIQETTGLGIYRNIQTVINVGPGAFISKELSAEQKKLGKERIVALRESEGCLEKLDRMVTRVQNLDFPVIEPATRTPLTLEGSFSKPGKLLERYPYFGLDGSAPCEQLDGLTRAITEAERRMNRLPNTLKPRAPGDSLPMVLSDLLDNEKERRADMKAWIKQAIAFEIAMLGKDPAAEQAHGGEKEGVDDAEPSISRAHRFELAIVGSLAFWITIGLLAGWQIQRRGEEHHQP